MPAWLGCRRQGLQARQLQPYWASKTSLGVLLLQVGSAESLTRSASQCPTPTQTSPGACGLPPPNCLGSCLACRAPRTYCCMLPACLGILGGVPVHPPWFPAWPNMDGQLLGFHALDRSRPRLLAHAFLPSRGLLSLRKCRTIWMP
jgi:hypothetical protein